MTAGGSAAGAGGGNAGDGVGGVEGCVPVEGMAFIPRYKGGTVVLSSSDDANGCSTIYGGWYTKVVEKCGRTLKFCVTRCVTRMGKNLQIADYA